MTFGKLFIWSAREIAEFRLPVTTEATLENTVEAMPATAPTFAAKPPERPLPMLWPVLLPVVLDASPNAFSMALPTPSMEGTMDTYAVARLYAIVSPSSVRLSGLRPVLHTVHGREPLAHESVELFDAHANGLDGARATDGVAIGFWVL